MKMNDTENKDLHVTEGVSGTYFYHLSAGGTNARALCGAQTMRTKIPLSSWGNKGHLNERYCAVCELLGGGELRAAGAGIPN